MTTELPVDVASTRAEALIGLGLCEAARHINLWSAALLLPNFFAALIAGSFNPSVFVPIFMAGLAAAVCQIYFAWRLAFDRTVFAAWANLRNDECVTAQHAFDAALRKLLKKGAPAEENRTMAERVMGTRRLHLFQIAALLGQVSSLLVPLLVFWWMRHA
jgi:hypothetical protein